MWSAGSVPLKRRMAWRIINQPRPRRSISRRTTMAFAIISLRERGAPPRRACCTVMWLGSAPGLVTAMRSSNTSSRTGDPVRA